jgi:hypothetical protein
VTILSILLLSVCIVFVVQLIIATIEKKDEFKKSIFLIVSLFAFLLSFSLPFENNLPITSRGEELNTINNELKQNNTSDNNNLRTRRSGGGGGGGGGQTFQYNATAAEQPLISSEQLKQISIGMSYGEVVRITGAEGALVLERGSARAYSYLKAEDPSISIRFIFENNILTAFFSI